MDVLSQIDAKGSRIGTVGAPIAPTDGATKQYVDTAAGSGGGLTAAQAKAIARRQAIVFS